MPPNWTTAAASHAPPWSHTHPFADASFGPQHPQSSQRTVLASPPFGASYQLHAVPYPSLLDSSSDSLNPSSTNAYSRLDSYQFPSRSVPSSPPTAPSSSAATPAPDQICPANDPFIIELAPPPSPPPIGSSYLPPIDPSRGTSMKRMLFTFRVNPFSINDPDRDDDFQNRRHSAPDMLPNFDPPLLCTFQSAAERRGATALADAQARRSESPAFPHVSQREDSSLYLNLMRPSYQRTASDLFSLASSDGGGSAYSIASSPQCGDGNALASNTPPFSRSTSPSTYESEDSDELAMAIAQSFTEASLSSGAFRRHSVAGLMSGASNNAHNIPTPSGAQSTTKPRKAHHCPICAKAFTRPSSLNTHMTVHTGAKPYICEVPSCGRKFSVHSNMRRHLESTHGFDVRKRKRRQRRSIQAQMPEILQQQADSSAIAAAIARAFPSDATESKVFSSPVAHALAPPPPSPRQTFPDSASADLSSRWIPGTLMDRVNAKELTSDPPFEFSVSQMIPQIPLPPVHPSTEPGFLDERDSFDESILENPYHPYAWLARSVLPGPGLPTTTTQPTSSTTDWSTFSLTMA